MSTFGGWMPEFPDIRVDFFRHVEGVRPPLACFLSHVHSDHLVGLESLKAPFVYCSAATKELLLRLERYPHRINFELGILESRKQHYKHLKNLLKPIPLETPTLIELAPGNDIQVTLFDANHCTGAIMFLIEGDGKAVLYTGDIRSESWFVNALTRNPLLIEYTSGLKELNCIYLDTSFTDDLTFPSKADGLKELLQKVARYPPHTTFHLEAWTFGYEEVWMALSRALKSPIHVDSYKMRLYKSLCGEPSGAERRFRPFLAREGPALTGYRVGNTSQPGILTLDHTVRLHSCEKGTRCARLDGNTVWIRPIITRTSSGQEIGEMGIGGGGGDLIQRVELEVGSDAIIQQLMASFAGTDSSILGGVRRMLMAGLQSTRKAVSLDDMSLDCEEDELSLEDLVKVLTRSVAKKCGPGETTAIQDENFPLPHVKTFPYSRHSSYAELRDLVKAFKPMDVYPCTVDKANWHEGISMKSLFGDLCSASIFRHDRIMREVLLDPDSREDTQKTQTTCSIPSSQEISSPNASDYGEDLGKERLDGDNVTLKPPTTDTATTPIRRMQSKLTIESGASSKLGNMGSLGRLILVEEPCKANQSLFKERSTASRPASDALLAFSPRSESQSLRRKAIFDCYDGIRRKRSRIDGDDADSRSLATGNCLDIVDRNDTSDRETEGVSDVSYYDAKDDVYRCRACGWEVWNLSGECAGCGAGEPAYYEAVQPRDSEGSREDREKMRDVYPGIALSLYCSDDDVESEVRADLTGDYLDGISAYDSATDAEGDEYEINSFIDDSSSRSEEDDENADDTSSGETDYEAAYQQLSSAYEILEQQHYCLIDDHDKFQRDVLGSDYYGSDEPDFEIVDIQVQDPPASKRVLSEIQGDSQASAISIRRLRTRVGAFIAVADGEGWHNVSLLSTGDNHIDAEVEL